MNSTRILTDIVSRIPRWSLTIAIVITIAILTLMPSDEMPDAMPWPHFDKVAHAMMFGALATVLVFDTCGHRPKVRLRPAITSMVISILIGGFIEILQQHMQMGRSGDIADFAADAAGAIIMPMISIPVINYILRYRNDKSTDSTRP